MNTLNPTLQDGISNSPSGDAMEGNRKSHFKTKMGDLESKNLKNDISNNTVLSTHPSQNISHSRAPEITTGSSGIQKPKPSITPKDERKNSKSKGDDEEPSATSAGSSDLQGLRAFQETLQKLRKMGRKFVTQVLKQALPTMVRMNSEMRLSSGCSGNLFKLAVGIRKLQEWAIKMLDSTGKIPAGILHGTLTEMGDYEQCQNIVVYNHEDKSKERFRGRYCSVRVQPYLPPGVTYHVYSTNKTIHDLEEMYSYLSRGSFRLGLCLPSSCSLKDVQQMASHVRKKIDLNVTVTWCEVKDSTWSLDKGQLAVCLFNGLMLGIVLLATITELTRRYLQKRRNLRVKERAETSFAVQAIESFSAYGNTKLQLVTGTQTYRLRVVDGIRVFAITWIILGETFKSMSSEKTNAFRKIFHLTEDPSFQMVIQFPFALDTLFFTSGILITYLALRRLKENNGQFSLLRYYVHRYWKLTPTFLIISGGIWLLEDLGSGPVWKESLDPLIKSCKKNWWTNVLYIGNFYKVEDRCLPHCGLISCLMQFFLVSPVVFLPLYRKPVIGKMLIITGILISVVTLAVITPLFNQMPVLLASITDHSIQMEHLRLIITMPYTHLGTYCVGMATGYFIYVYREKKLRVHPIVVLCGWSAAVACNLTIVFGLYQWNSGKSFPSKTTAAVYAALCRLGWSLGLSWLTIACVHGYGGIINSFLSWKGFSPLSRLTYIVYIIQPAWIGIFQSHLRSPIYYSNIFITYIFIAYVTISYTLGFLTALVYQTPFLNLEQLVLKAASNEKKITTNEDEEESDRHTFDIRNKTLNLDSNSKSETVNERFSVKL
ncbi:nose resistant to fluoxetine protein 6-like isoform X2 [Tachypleus tridentatus]